LKDSSVRKKTRLLPALAFSMALVPVAEVTAIAVATRHDVAMTSAANQHHSSAAEATVVEDPFSVSGQAGHAAGYELIMVNSTPVWVRIH
jgi:hypothetical protein